MTEYDSIVDAVAVAAGQHPDRTAVALVTDPDDGPDQRLTYGRLDHRARRLAATLRHDLGLSPGSRVLLCFPQDVGFAVGFVGCLYAGLTAVTAPLPSGSGFERRRVAQIARSSRSTAVLTVGRSRAAVEEWVTDQDLTGVSVVDVEATGDGADGGDGVGGDSHGFVVAAADPDDVALLQYTSGSTAQPKGVVVRHRHITANVASLFRGYPLAPGTVFGGWIPMYHDMGLLALLSPALLSHSSCVLMEATTFLRRPWAWLRMIERFGVGVSAAPDFAYALCVQRVTDEQRASLDLSGWSVAINGSEPVDPGTLRRFTETFAGSGLAPGTLRPSYGLAEATVFVSAARPGLRTVPVDAAALREHRWKPAAAGVDGTREIVSCGPPQDLDVAIVDPDTGRDAPADRVGEIWLRGGCVADGYWEAPEATGDTFVERPDGRWLRTGDLGVVHDGELHVTGRIKELVIVNGRNFYPHDIEQELRDQHPELGHVGAVFTVPGPAAADAVVVGHEVSERLDEDASARLVSGLRRTLVQQFGLHAAGVLLLPRGGVPRTTSGKVRRRGLREQFLDGTARTTYLDDGARALTGARD